MTEAFYGVIVSNRAGDRSGHGGQPYRWSPRFDSAGEARAWGKTAVEAGSATLAFVVHMSPEGGRELIEQMTYPASAGKIIKHWEAVWDLLDEPPPGL